MEPHNEKIEMSTLSGCMNRLKGDEFTEDFSVVGNSLVVNKSDRSFKPHEVKIVNFYRFEGDSDPSDNAILYAIETNNGVKGVLVDAYGMYSNSKITEFIKEVEDINKKTDK